MWQGRENETHLHPLHHPLPTPFSRHSYPHGRRRRFCKRPCRQGLWSLPASATPGNRIWIFLQYLRRPQNAREPSAAPKKLVTPERNRSSDDIMEATECLKAWWDSGAISVRANSKVGGLSTRS